MIQILLTLAPMLAHVVELPTNLEVNTNEAINNATAPLAPKAGINHFSCQNETGAEDAMAGLLILFNLGLFNIIYLILS